MSTSIVDTEYGKALEVRGSDDARLVWHATWDDEDGDWYLNLSMTAGDVHDYSSFVRSSWMFSDRENLSIALSFSAEQSHLETPTWPSGGGPLYALMGSDGDYTLEPEAGWQPTSVEFGWMVAN